MHAAGPAAPSRTSITNASAATNVWGPASSARFRKCPTITFSDFSIYETCDFDKALIPSVETNFANPAPLLRLAEAVLLKQNDEWEAADRCFFSEQSMARLTTTTNSTQRHVRPSDLTTA